MKINFNRFMWPPLFKFKKVLFLVMAILLSYSFVAKAQETTSEISGTITEGKSPMPNVIITAVHVPTGTKYMTTTRSDGRYNLPNLKIGGPYTLTTTFVGYKPETRSDIFLNLGQTFKEDFSLSDANTLLGEIVVKSSNDKNFNSSRMGSQELITRTQVDRLPTINRSIQDFVKLEPTSN